MKDILIQGGTIVNEGRRFRGWLLVRDGIIAEVGEGECLFAGEFGGTRIEASGKIVMPGVIDPHVHFREPGLTAKGDMASESAAAVAGGVTSVLEMPNTVPPVVSRDELERKFDRAEGRMHTNYSFFLGATADNLGEILHWQAGGGRLVKLFMGSSTGGMLVEDGRALAGLFAEFGGVIAAHCEDEGIIRANTDIYRKRFGERATATIHPLVRSDEACYLSTARAVELADRYGAQLHVCHVSTARELGLFDGGEFVGYGASGAFGASGASGASGGYDSYPVATKQITAEACVPHLWFSDEDYVRLGNRIKCNPAIKSTVDREALREAIGGVGEYRGKIDLIATDHAPHTADEKARGYWEAPSGIPSVQYSLSVMFELAGQGVMTLETVVNRMCHAPAVRFGLAGSGVTGREEAGSGVTGREVTGREEAGRGFLRKGYKADIVIVDPAFVDPRDGRVGWAVEPENILSKCGWSPWEGVRFGARVVTTIVGGCVAWDGTRVSETAKGERLVIKGRF